MSFPLFKWTKGHTMQFTEDEREIAKKIKKLISLEIDIMQIEILRHHLPAIKLAWIF